MPRPFKQTIIIAIYLIIFGFFGWGVYKLFFWTAPSCDDGVRNQRETGIDCGGPCAACPEVIQAKSIEVLEQALVDSSQSQTDVVVKVKNPNDLYGAKVFKYKLVVYDTGGAVLAERSGEGYILPIEEKYIVETNIATASQAGRVELKVDDASTEWVDFVDYRKPEFDINNVNVDEESVNGRVSGMFYNRSRYDFNKIRINIVLRDQDGRPLAVNSHVMSSVDSKSQREINLTWPTPFSGSVSKVEVEAEVNVFDPDSYMEKKLPGGRFQELPGAKTSD